MMKKIDINHFIDLLKKCRNDGCTEIIFKVEPCSEHEISLTVVQDDNAVIVSTKKVIF